MSPMQDLTTVAQAFLEMAHRIVWCTAATVDDRQQPRTRILHPYWQFDGTSLRGWIATGPTPVKKTNLDTSPFLSCNYWESSHDTCYADCRATWAFDDETRTMVWELFASTPRPLGYDPAMIPQWADGPTSPAFAALALEPLRLRVFPGSVLLGEGGEVLTWRA